MLDMSAKVKRVIYSNFFPVNSKKCFTIFVAIGRNLSSNGLI